MYSLSRADYRDKYTLLVGEFVEVLVVAQPHDVAREDEQLPL